MLAAFVNHSLEVGPGISFSGFLSVYIGADYEHVSSAFTSYLTNFRRYLDIDDVGTDYVLNPTSGNWEQRYLLPPHVEPKKENDHDESEQQ